MIAFQKLDRFWLDDETKEILDELDEKIDDLEEAKQYIAMLEQQNSELIVAVAMLEYKLGI